jgi:Mg/Co/Ni transporter MgtE
MTIVSLEVESPRYGPDGEPVKERYTELSVGEIIRERLNWLVIFFFGLMLAAAVVEVFESVLKEHVELSYFVPLLIGHGGNTGAQANATVIRALALGHLRPSDYLMVMRKEALAGGAMGAFLGLCLFLFSFLWSGLPRGVAVTVAISLPVVSVWANFLGGVFPLLSAYLGKNPAVTSAPLMTTVVDATGLAIYLYIGKLIIGI